LYNTIRKRKGEQKMTREKIREEIEKLENRKFMNNMVDRWTAANYQIDRELTEQIRNLKNLLDN